MILQALYDYYQKKKESLPAEGFELRELKFIIVINKKGEFKDLVDLREKKKGKQYLLPRSTGRAGSNSWQTTFLLWDHYGYVLGHPKDKEKKAKEMAKKQKHIFVDTLKNLPDKIKKDAGVKAVLSFYETKQIAEVKKHLNWKQCSEIPGCNLTFRLDGETELIPQRNSVVEYQKTMVSSSLETEDDDDKQQLISHCLITGERGSIARLHTATPILGSKSNAKVVAFQKNSGFDSYGKEQAFNAPISIQAEAAYSTALKHLLNSPTNKIIISDSTIVFWSENTPKVINLEEVVSWVVATQKSNEENPDARVQVVKALYDSVFTGRLSQEKDNHFYVLALAPNAARISVRFWRTGTVEEFGKRIYQHFEDFKIAHGPKELEHLSLYQILSSTALQYKMENVPPNLTGKVIESILDGTPYPVTLMQQCIRRIRAEQQVNRSRAAILKAYINRFNRIHQPTEKEISMALDTTNTNSGYRIGRLFAVLEKIQEEASPNINTTIRDRFYGAASSSPVAVFSQLLKLKNHHLAKLEIGRKIYFERLIGEVMAELSSLPAHLPLNEQAYFSIGYYHQRQDFFTSKKNKIESDQQL